MNVESGSVGCKFEGHRRTLFNCGGRVQERPIFVAEDELFGYSGRLLLFSCTYSSSFEIIDHCRLRQFAC
jgi:hypothetical protein